MKQIIIFIIFSLTTILVFGQEIAESFTLNQPIQPNITRNLIANEFINLINKYPTTGGFHVKPDENNQFNAQIDPNMVIPPWDNEWGGTLENNAGGGVGSLVGKLNVTDNGAMEYVIPFEIPDGLNGLKPNLSFVYNSMAGDGIMGDGWSIGGLSKITRVPNTYYYNSFTSSIILNSTDQLMLDGNYLIKTATNEYKPEVETYEKIVVKDGNINNGFYVYKKNGLIYEYGQTDNSKLYLQENQTPISWYLCKIKDLNNNYIEFNYINDKDNGDLYPDFIIYTGNSQEGTDPFYRISFNYRSVERTNNPRRYFANNNQSTPLFTKQTMLLREVEIIYLADNSIVKKFEFHYNKMGELGREYLVSIYPNFNMAERSTRWLNPTKFDWKISNFDIDMEEEDLFIMNHDNPFSNIIQQGVFTANFDDKQKSDVLFLVKNTSNNINTIKAYLNWSDYYGDNTNFDFRFNTSPGYSTFNHSFDENVNNLFISPGDFNGDGIDEILRVSFQGQNLYLYIGNFIFSGVGGYEEELVLGPFSISDFEPDHPPVFLVNDFSGNGMDDLCIISNSGRSQKTIANCYFFLSLIDNPFNNIVTNPNAIIESPEKTLTGDFNGNGKTELLTIGNSSAMVISLFDDNTSFHAFSTTNDFTEINYLNDIVVGDFNNDAKTDVLLLKQGATDNWKYYFSYGKGLFVNTITKDGEDIGAKEVQKFIVDVNGDGYDDVCRIKNWIENINDQQYKLYFRTDYLTTHSNDNINIIQKIYNEPITSIIYPGERQEVNFCLGNFSGNSLNQLICSRVWSNTNNIYAKISLTAPIYNTFHNEIVNIKDAFGNDHSLTYHPYTAIPIPKYKLPLNNTSVNTELEYPIIQYPGILQLVTELKTEVVHDNFFSTKYYYQDPKYHKIGKGFLGFDNINIFDDITGLWTSKHFSLDEYYYHIVNNLTEIKIKISDINYKKVKNIHKQYVFRNMESPPGIRYYPILEEELIETFELDENLKQRIKLHYSDFNEYGNPKEIIKSYSTNYTKWPISQTTNINYKNITAGGKYIIGLPEQQTILYKKDGKPNITNHFEYGYFENTNCKLKFEKTEPSDPKTYSNNYEYDNFGNISKQTLVGNGMEDRINTNVYFDNGRFIDYSVNSEGHTTSFTFYEKTGLPKTITDANGLITTFSKYDIFGRLKEKTLPNDNKATTVYRWSVSGTSSEHELAPETAIMYKWTKTSGNTEQLTFYNSFNQIVREVTKSFNGNWRIKDNNYHGNIPYYSGLVKEESMPYFWGEETFFSKFTYDKLRRLTKTEKPDASYSQYTYNATNTIFQDFDGQTRKDEYNAAGWITKTTNNQTGTINNGHTSDGLVDEVIINANTETKVAKTYDVFRNIKSLKDPDNGLTEFTYNSLGELVDENDELNSIKFTYDKLGRITSKETPDLFTKWLYDTHENGIGKLYATETMPTHGEIRQIFYEYNYDEFTRLIRIKQSLNDDQIETNYTYDVYGRLKSTIWPSEFITQNYYNSNGFLNYITDSNQKILWKLIEQDQFDNPSKYELGNNIITRKTFNAINGRLTDIVSNNATQIFQNYHYDWEIVGNLHLRQDLISNIKESFTYDSFNRLTECWLNNTLQLNTDFNGIGNITFKLDVGIYKYDEPELHPHAVTGIDGTPETISRLIQTIDYSSFDKVIHISEKENSKKSEDVFTLDISYGPENERVWQIFVNNQTGITIEKRFFNSVFETIEDEQGSKKELHYLSSPSGIFAIFTLENNENGKMQYLLKDHLRSINQIIDEEANILQKLNFDAWGRRRNPETWTYEGIENESFIIDRGFTMHEHYDNIKLINMNGRMYDPVMGRFLSTDPIIQLPNYNQSYNRYTYALNNPLRYTDPSGFSFIENMDWFINNKTGDVFYNSEYSEGDENKIKGNGWQHFAKNGELSLSGESNYHILMKTQGLGNIVPYPKYDSYTSIDAKMTSFTLEATFKGKNAEVFMNGQGYDKLPDTYKYHYDVTTDYLPEAESQISLPHDNSQIEQTLSIQYVNKDFILSQTIIGETYKDPKYRYFKYAWFSPAYHIRQQSWTYRKDIYGNHSSSSNVLGKLNFIDNNTNWKAWYWDLWGKIIKGK